MKFNCNFFISQWQLIFLLKKKEKGKIDKKQGKKIG